VDKFVFPLLIAASILTVVIGLYDIMISGKEDIEKGTKYIIFGVLGIVIIQSAKFITSTYIGIITKVVPYDNTSPTVNFAQSAYEIYNQLIMPFINVFMYAVIGTLFVILLVHVMRFITSSEEDVAAKAKSIMISNVVGIIVILLAKTMVETIYGKQETVIKSSAATNL
jgi:Type IV secretion system pilin